MNRSARFIVGGLLISVVVAAGIAQFASDQPDGLEYVAEDAGFADTAEESHVPHTRLRVPMFKINSTASGAAVEGGWRPRWTAGR